MVLPLRVISPFRHHLICQDKYSMIQNPFLSKKEVNFFERNNSLSAAKSEGKIYLRDYWKKNRPPLSSELKFKVALLHVAQLLQLLSLMSLQPLSEHPVPVLQSKNKRALLLRHQTSASRLPRS